MHPAAWLVPRSVALRAGPWDERLSLNDDGEYFTRVLLQSSGVKFCWGARTYYRSGNSGSLSASQSRGAWESALLSFQLSASSLLAAETSERTRYACASVFQRYSYEAFPQQPDLAHVAETRARELGGSDVAPSGGPVFHLLSRVLGWKRASRMRHRAYRVGYQRAAIGWRAGRVLKRWRRPTGGLVQPTSRT